MSISSKHRKVKPKGVVREFKLVETVTRNGKEALRMEEVKMPRLSSQNASTSARKSSSSPKKRRKLEEFDEAPLFFDPEQLDLPTKRQTLVSMFPFQPTTVRLTI